MDLCTIRGGVIDDFCRGGAFVSKRKPMPVTVADVCHNIFWGRNHRAIRLLSICFEIYEALTDY